MKTAIVVGRNSVLHQEVKDVLKKLQLEPRFVTIPQEQSRYRGDAKDAFMTAILRQGIKLEEGMAIVRLNDSHADIVLAQGAKSAVIDLTASMTSETKTVEPIMISYSRGQVVVVQGNQPYPVPA